MKGRSRTIALAGILTALAFALAYVERLLPLELPVPGFKLGLANIITLFALYHLNLRYAFMITILRCAFSAVLFSGVTTLVFSLAGGFLSLIVMWALKRYKCFSPYGVSIAGAAAHNAGQVSAAALMLGTTGIYSYLSLLFPISVATGFATAFVYVLLDRALPAQFINAGGLK